MGSCISCVCKTIIIARTIVAIIDSLDINCTLEEFLAAHNSGTIEENKEGLAELATDLELTNETQLSNTSLKKCVYICCNTYTKPSYSLGVGPMNDAITVASYMSSIGYDVYFYHNPKSADFLNWLKFFLQNTEEELVVYYTGHGASVDDENGDESDGKDECFVFDDNFVVDDELAEYLKKYKNSKCKLLTINDCCHSGTIWDLDSSGVPSNCISLSAAEDSETAKQTSMDGKEQGMFTFYLYKLIQQNPSMTPSEMKTKITPYLSKYDQCFTTCTTTQSLLTSPIFE